MKYLMILITLLLLQNCLEEPQHEIQRKKSHPSHSYTYVDIKKESFNYREIDYAPVYSDIYHIDGTQSFELTTTISIRNTSLKDSAYVLSAVFYDSYGKKINNYVDSTILLTPLETIEFVVEEVLERKGPGDNFVIEWGASNYSNQLLVQSIMIGTYDRQGISFLTDAKVIERIKKK